MAKRSDGRSGLSAEEARALLKESNDALFGPGPEPFVSRKKFAPSDMAERVRSIAWFSRVGEPDDAFDVSMPVERVKSWPAAMKALKSRAWEAATLDARNQLSERLSDTHRDRSRQWNKITADLKRTVIVPLEKKTLEPFREAWGLDVELLHSVRWNVLAALMENAYIDCDHGSFFFHELLTVYEAGHLPCGWIGEWPTGKLVVY